MITSSVPANWQDLQGAAARILRECRFAVQVEKKLQTARGTVEVDVYSEEDVNGRRYVVLCECKHWKNRVPQNVVHGFRSVLADCGGNIGYLISSSGFQSGSFGAADLTNVRLVTWPEFQQDFEQTWVQAYMMPMLWDRLNVLMSHTEIGGPLALCQLSVTEKAKLDVLWTRYRAFGWMMTTIFLALQRPSSERRLPALPLRSTVKFNEAPGADLIPAAVLDATGYREMIDAATRFGDSALAEYGEVRPELRDSAFGINSV